MFIHDIVALPYVEVIKISIYLTIPVGYNVDTTTICQSRSYRYKILVFRLRIPAAHCVVFQPFNEFQCSFYIMKYFWYTSPQIVWSWDLLLVHINFALKFLVKLNSQFYFQRVNNRIVELYQCQLTVCFIDTVLSSLVFCNFWSEVLKRQGFN